MIKRSIIVVSVLISSFFACEPQIYDDPIPYVPVDFEVNLNDPQFLELNTRNYVYINTEGVRGIILYKQDRGRYLAFERNCSFTPNEACATVDVHTSGLYMMDTCCGSIFDWEGNPTSGPAYRPLLKYNTRISGTYLHIFNDDF
ncbi:MAG: hypothetical protein ACNS62_25485 [Candidatus Cyclobacteriaceae bacterium M3_2C_046]